MSNTMISEKLDYTFHRSNIHERRRLATFARLFPLFCFLAVVAWAALGFALSETMLLTLCAVLNVSLCLGMSYSGVLCLLGIQKVAKELQSEAVEIVQEEGIQHVIVIANYKEDAGILSQTLTSLAQAHGSHSFHVVLAMEAREGDPAVEKATTLTEKFGKHFASLTSTWHPTNLRQVHMDGSWDPEIPGKASNLKQAVNDVYRELMKDGKDASSLLLTVADADVLFHPRYFNHIATDYVGLRNQGGDYECALWQAPQLPFRNYFASPACSRVWAYVASLYEFGGVSGLSLGSDHFVFSTYSLPLRLAVEAEAHEGDVIAEDHHCYIRCFFYSVMKEAQRRAGADVSLTGFGAKTQLRPVFLPVKATSVVSETALQTWKDRWLQAKRHAQGVAEVSCIVLSAADALRQLPFHLWTWQFSLSVARMAGRLMYIHMLPSCQFVATIFLALTWVCNGFQIELCGSDTRYPLLCGAAGVWNPAWPAIPITVFIVACSIAMVFVVYLQPLQRGHFHGSIWTSEAGGLPATCGSSFWTLSGLVLWDCLIFAGVLVLPYGIMVEILAFWNVAFRGNRFEYVTATKALATEMQSRPLLTT